MKCLPDLFSRDSGGSLFGWLVGWFIFVCFFFVCCYLFACLLMVYSSNAGENTPKLIGDLNKEKNALAATQIQHCDASCSRITPLQQRNLSCEQHHKVVPSP